jgi:hypothetical protein
LPPYLRSIAPVALRTGTNQVRPLKLLALPWRLDEVERRIADGRTMRHTATEQLLVASPCYLIAQLVLLFATPYGKICLHVRPTETPLDAACLCLALTSRLRGQLHGLRCQRGTLSGKSIDLVASWPRRFVLRHQRDVCIHPTYTFSGWSRRPSAGIEVAVHQVHLRARCSTTDTGPSA